VRRVLAVRGLVADGWTVRAATARVMGEAGEQSPRPDVERLRRQLVGAIDEVLQDLAGPPPRPDDADAGPSAGTRRPGRPARAAALGRTRPMLTTPAEHDFEVAAIVHQATRALLQIGSAREAVRILVAVVEQLGAEAVPAHLAGDSALPIDLSFGEVEPLLPVAEPLSVARLRLEEVLPGLVEDARRMVALVRRLEALEP
jgi:hypothetical protein